MPQNKTAVVRENVTFECIVGSTLPQEERDYYIRVLLEFTLPSSSNSSQSFRATCSLDLCTPAKKDYPLVFNNHVLQSRDAIENVSFTAQVPYVSEDYNGSIFVCTIMYKNVIQWQREAHLTLVSPPLPEGGTTSNYKTTAHTESTTTEEEEETPLVHNSVKVTIAVCIVVVAIITVMVVVSIPIAFMLKKKRQLYRFPPDEGEYIPEFFYPYPTLLHKLTHTIIIITFVEHCSKVRMITDGKSNHKCLCVCVCVYSPLWYYCGIVPHVVIFYHVCVWCVDWRFEYAVPCTYMVTL